MKIGTELEKLKTGVTLIESEFPRAERRLDFFHSHREVLDYNAAIQ